MKRLLSVSPTSNKDIPKMWVDPSYKRTAGVDPNDIASIGNKLSGTLPDFTQATGTMQPAYNAIGINNLPCIETSRDRASEALRSSSPSFFRSGIRFMCFAYEWEAFPVLGTGSILVDIGIGATATYFINADKTTQKIYAAIWDGLFVSDKITADSVIIAGETNVVATAYDPAKNQHRMWVNNVSQGTPTGTGFPLTYTDPLEIALMAFHNATSNYASTARMGEFIYMETIPPDNAIHQINQYMMNKYGVS